MTPLSPRTEQVVQRLFAADLRESVRDMLVQRCGNNLPFLEKLSPEELERVRFAVLKLSLGTLEGLEQAVAVAGEDWRDTLMGAGFGHSLSIHLQWCHDITGQ